MVRVPCHMAEELNFQSLKFNFNGHLWLVAAVPDTGDLEQKGSGGLGPQGAKRCPGSGGRGRAGRPVALARWVPVRAALSRRKGLWPEPQRRGITKTTRDPGPVLLLSEPRLAQTAQRLQSDGANARA